MKAYVLLYSNTTNHLYFPIKAVTPPYHPPRPFQQNMPQFFGGTVCPPAQIITGPTLHTAFNAEVLQESQGLFSLVTASLDSELILLHETVINHHQSKFYALASPHFNISDEINWLALGQNNHYAQLNTAMGIPAALREMRAVVRINRDTLIRQAAPTPGVPLAPDTAANKIQRMLALISQPGPNPPFTQGANPGQWNGSETYQAFENFFER